MKDVSDTELQALVRHYGLALDPPDSYNVNFGNLNGQQYDTILQNLTSGPASGILPQDEGKPLGVLAQGMQIPTGRNGKPVDETPWQQNRRQQGAWSAAMDNAGQQATLNFQRPDQVPLPDTPPVAENATTEPVPNQPPAQAAGVPGFGGGNGPLTPQQITEQIALQNNRQKPGQPPINPGNDPRLQAFNDSI